MALGQVIQLSCRLLINALRHSIVLAYHDYLLGKSTKKFNSLGLPWLPLWEKALRNSIVLGYYGYVMMTIG